MLSHFLECNHTGRDKYLQHVCMGRIHAWEPQASSSPFKPPKGFERPWHQSPDPPCLCFILFFSLSIRECLWEWFALYSASDQAGGCADLHTMCLSSLSRHFNLHCSKKFGTQRFLLRATLERLFQRFDCAGFPPLFRGCMCGGRTSDRKPLNLGCFNPISLGFHCWNDSAR